MPDTGAMWAAAGWQGPPYTVHYSRLISRSLTVAATGEHTLKFKHRYNFEGGYDGGAVFVSVNGETPAQVPKSAFIANMYNVNLSGSSAFNGLDVFGGQSADWDKAAYIESVATLGSFTHGDRITVEFRGGWDEGYAVTPPDWEISSVQVTDSLSADLFNVTFTDGAGGFSVTSDAGMDGPWIYAGAETCRFEIDATAKTADWFTTSEDTPINLNSAKLLVEVIAGTLSIGDTYTLFDTSNGRTLEGAYSSLSLPPGTWDLSGLQPGGNGTIRLLDSSVWTPTAMGTYSWDHGAHWTNGIPNSAGKVADLRADLAGAQTIDLNQVTTVGVINLGDSGSPYFPMTIAAGTAGSLVMDNISDSAAIARTKGIGVQDIISANILLNDNLILSDVNGSDSGNALTIAGAIRGTGMSVTVNGPGAVCLSGTNTYDNGTTVNGGYFKFSPGSIGAGPLTITGNSATSITSGNLPMTGNEVWINGNFKTPEGLKTGSGAITISSAGIQIFDSITLGGVVSGPGGLNALDVIYACDNGMGTGGEFQAPVTLRDSQTVKINGGTYVGENQNYSVFATLNLSGIISDGGLGYGLRLSSDTRSAKLLLSAENTYSGDTTVDPCNVLHQWMGVVIGNNLALQNSALVVDHPSMGSFGDDVTRPTIGGLKGNTDLAQAFAPHEAWVSGNYNRVTVLTLNPLSGTCGYTGGIANGASAMSLVKTGAGTQELAGVNTYTGNTVVNAGTLKLIESASLKFAIGANKVSTRMLGNGIVILDGAFDIDISGAAMAPGNNWTLVNVSTLSATFGPTFTVTGWTKESGVWTMMADGNTWRFSEANGILTFSGGYATWANSFTPPLSNTAANADPDGDGLANSVEYVIGTDPRYANPGGPTVAVAGSDLVVTFTRTDDSESPDVSLMVQVSANLSDWTSIPGYAIGATTETSTSGVMVAENGAANDTITVTIPKGAYLKSFARLKVSVTE